MKIWVRRRREVARTRNRAANRLHAVLLELVPGGIHGEISAGQAAKVLEGLAPTGAVGTARRELAEELLDDLRRLDAQLRELMKRIADVVAASKTTTTEIFGVGPVVAATVVGITGDVRRFATKDRFAAYNGTAPVEASSGPHIVHRLSRRGNRQLNHAIHMAAVTQVRHRHSEGRAYFDRKIAEGKSRKMALRALKRRVSDALYNAMVSDANRAAESGPGGQTGNDSVSSVAGSHPEHRHFGRATPGPSSTLRQAPRRSQRLSMPVARGRRAP
jgi:transposase